MFTGFKMIYATDFCCDYILRAVTLLIPSPAWVGCIVVVEEDICAKCQSLPSVLVEVGEVVKDEG